ncbi:hypothetical protein AVEN_1884-1 [Araneus ventricosus]|uniref:Uncharacterized protein n=1 Tax=Araneus ventricosus TaxID=182803 RepID=A0A4Y2G868_ARAVE|nr:hypothetical protein AVEN_1884-1 [Araneus ventricosus]
MPQKPPWPSCKVSALVPESSRFEPDSTENPPCMGSVARQIIRSWQTSFPWCSVGVRRADANMRSSSSDRCSKLRAPSQNSPRVASKRGVNITKPNLSMPQ